MKLLKNEKTDKYHEIEIGYFFLWFKWSVKYRKINGNILRFKFPNEYYHTSIHEYIRVKDLFEIFV